MGSDGASCDVAIPGFFLSIIPDDKKETNIRTKLGVIVEKSVSDHLKGYWGLIMEGEYKLLLEKFGEEMMLAFYSFSFLFFFSFSFFLLFFIFCFFLIPLFQETKRKSSRNGNN